MKAISEGINDLMLLGLDNFFSENVDNDIDGATDNATSHEILEFEDYVRILIPGGLIKVRKSRKKYVVLDSSKKRMRGKFYVLKIARAVVFWKNPEQHIFFEIF